jgi:tetratricopeptide (TPR) repeat protein
MRAVLFGVFVLFLTGVEAAQQASAPTFQTIARQADAARDAKDLEKAMTLYRQALKLKPDWDEGWWNLGSIAYDLDRYNDGAPAFQKLAHLKPESAPAWTMAGLCEYKLRDYPAAIRSFGEVERLKFQEPASLAQAARLHYALVLTKTESFEKAIAILTDLTRGDRKTPEVVVAAGIAGLRRPWLPFEVPEGDRELVFKLGDAMAAAMGFEFKAAIQKFEEVAQQFPSEPNVHFRFGAFLNTQDSEKGIEEIKKAVELAPNHVPALVGLAAIYLKREDRDAALGYAELAVRAAPEDFSTHVVLGRALLAKEEPARAASELEAAVKLAPASPEARFSLASAYSRLDRKEDAARELTEFKRLQRLEK